MQCCFIFWQHLRSQYAELFPSLYNDHPDIFPQELYTWEHFLWACELWYSNSMKVIFPDGKLRTCLIPIAGFLNHSVNFLLAPFSQVSLRLFPTCNPLIVNIVTSWDSQRRYCLLESILLTPVQKNLKSGWLDLKGNIPSLLYLLIHILPRFDSPIK